MSDANVPTIVPLSSLGYGFIPPEYLPPGLDEYHLRNQQNPRPAHTWRALTPAEIIALESHGNRSTNWDDVRVADPFDPYLVNHCEFHGLVRIGRLTRVGLSYHELTVPVGLSHSRILACDLGDNVAIHSVRHLAHYIVGERAILLNIDEMHVSNHAKFGNGIVKQGEPEDVRIWMDLINEAGGRGVLPFDGMRAADAMLWASRPEDTVLTARLSEITQRQFDPRRGYYGLVGEGCVIKSCRVIKDVCIGPGAYIKGANKLKNLTINSSRDEPTQIGEGVELVNGILGRGCRVFYGCKAVRFVLGPNSALKYGARLIHSYLGDNSTVSCCELLNNLIFPAHEQHHNNSFLVASLVRGQSNIAAGATIGSNHNSRAPDGELHAGRGFWPGLCVSLKHNCRFASYTLLAKGDYPAELDIPLPFSLVSQDLSRDRLQVMPAYWWLYNMYALARNDWKFHARDRRTGPCQHIEFDVLAPDTVEEILAALDLLALWTGQADHRLQSTDTPLPSPERLRERGRALLEGDPADLQGLAVLAEGLENARRPAEILKPQAAWRAYRQMLHHYALRTLLAWRADHPDATLADLAETLDGPRQHRWENLGGQLMTRPALETLCDDIRAGQLGSWDAIHARYDALWARYGHDKARHAWAVLGELLGTTRIDLPAWQAAVDQAVAIQRHVAQQVRTSRAKDHANPFRTMVYTSIEQMRAVLGTPAQDSFTLQVDRHTADYETLAAAWRDRE